MESQKKKFEFMLLTSTSLFFSINYSIQASSVLIFSHFKPVFSIFQGFQLISGGGFMDILLPGCSFIEKKSVFLGFKGSLKVSEKTQPLLGQAREDWRILNSIFLLIVNGAKFNSKIFRTSSETSGIFNFKKNNSIFFKNTAGFFNSNHKFFYKSVLLPAISDFYRTDSVSILSKNLALCGKYSLRLL